jgi:hypothetical protein
MERDATISRTESNIKKKTNGKRSGEIQGFRRRREGEELDGKPRSREENYTKEEEYKSQLGVIETTDEKIKEEKQAREDK